MADLWEWIGGRTIEFSHSHPMHFVGYLSLKIGITTDRYIHTCSSSLYKMLYKHCHVIHIYLSILYYW